MDNKQSQNELVRWRIAGEALWPILRLMPLSGCNAQVLEIVEDVADLLGVDLQGEIDRSVKVDASERSMAAIADFIVEKYLRRLDPRCREQFEQDLDGIQASIIHEIGEE